ncbi:hypothetical protein HDU85_004775 [Gaertneriomyces sp. JEL0708]|nr:hypothetical protein HDU85_004775 [Gaertneriomyces sp. JEL0708]
MAVPQPLIDEHSNVLCFNGEVFGGVRVASDECDTAVLSRMLAEVLRGATNVHDAEEKVLRLFEKIEGPYAFVLFMSRFKRLYFGRDLMGRRSLLWNINSTTSSDFIISSVGDTSVTDLEDVPADGMYCIDIDDSLVSLGHIKTSMRTIPWLNCSLPQPVPYLFKPFGDLEPVLPTISSLPSADNCLAFPYLSGIQDILLNIDRLLTDSIRVRLETIPPPIPGSARAAILFSGGLDCAVLAALADRVLPPDEPIDLLNVAFENPRIAHAKQAKKPKSRTTPIDASDSIYDVPDRLTALRSYAELRARYPHRSYRLVLIDVPYQELEHRKADVISALYPKNTVMDFSIGVAFWWASRGIGCLYDGSNAITAATTQECRESGNSIKPSETYVSKARVVLTGLGPDELLGGYSSHLTAFTHPPASDGEPPSDTDCWASLLAALSTSLTNLPSRNLSRDDRLISSHGKEARFPYLCTDFIRYITTLPVHYKLDLRFDKSVGPKMLLRRYCAEILGLQGIAVEVKRAVQFGARSAKMGVGDRGAKGADLIA